MNRYPLWKYLLILAIIVPGILYFLPNLYGEDPAIQISATRTTKVDAATHAQVEQALKHAGIEIVALQRDDKSIKARFRDTDTQSRAREVVQQALGDNYTVALNLLPATPAWIRAIGANPMYLGLDLRGGVHFLMQVDMPGALKKAEERYVDDLRSLLRDKKVRYLTVNRLDGGGLEIRFREAAERDKAREVVRIGIQELLLTDAEKGGEYTLLARLTDQALVEKRKFALDQNITTLRNRVNELGVAEPVIQQQGDDRIVVQLPGVQDTAKAKELLGRTATLEIMMVDEEHDITSALSGR
ncbi:MAG: protein translocase subunit SecD, partial [Gammaproteobacteria bacterium]|nr:protein translocase subunit SecD [Gammaproteobacteria bacterium]